MSCLSHQLSCPRPQDSGPGRHGDRCLVDMLGGNGTGGGSERWINGGSGTGILLAGYGSRNSRRVCCEEGPFSYGWCASCCEYLCTLHLPFAERRSQEDGGHEGCYNNGTPNSLLAIPWPCRAGSERFVWIPHLRYST